MMTDDLYDDDLGTEDIPAEGELSADQLLRRAIDMVAAELRRSSGLDPCRKSSLTRTTTPEASGPPARGSRSTNSSPPYRAATSIRRKFAVIAFAATIRSWSPIWSIRRDASLPIAASNGTMPA